MSQVDQVAPQLRTDSVQLRPAARDPNGWLRADAILTRVGVFEYPEMPMTDGRPRRELRPPEEVFAPEAIASFAGKPVTDGHPKDETGKRILLDGRNTRDHARGHLGDQLEPCEDVLTGSLYVIDSDLVARMDAGVREVSLGYSMEIDETPGVWRGQPYDAVQRKIRGNHVAVVPAGRAGAVAAVRLDGLEEGTMAEKNEPAAGGEGSTKAVKIGEAEYQLPMDVAMALALATAVEIDGVMIKLARDGATETPTPKLDEGMGMKKPDEYQQRMDEAIARALAPMQQRFDAVEAQNRALKDELATARAGEPARYAARREQERRLMRLLGGRFDEIAHLEGVEQLRAGVAMLRPETAEKLKTESADYLRSRFDAIEEAAAGETPLTRSAGALAGIRTDSSGSALEEARQRMIKEQLTNVHATARAQG